MSHPLLIAAMAEAKRARDLFPSPRHLVLAFAEESGEVVKAALDYFNGSTDPDATESMMAEVEKELIQACAMLIRLYDEGDPTIRLDPINAPGDDG